MIRDSKLSGVLHVLLHMADVRGPVTSDAMARVMQTNPVVIRRILAGLREQGFVTAEKGHGGGWQLACDATTITLRDIYSALGSPTLIAMGNRTESPGCPVEQAVNTMMNQAFHDAETLLLERFGEVTLAALQEQVRHHRRAHMAASTLGEARTGCHMERTNDHADSTIVLPNAETN